MKELEIIKHYQKVFDCEQFILTGSTALKYHGLVMSSNDIDIILVNPTNSCLAVLDKLAPIGEKKKDYANARIFKHDEVKIDVFIDSAKLDCCSYDGINLSPVRDIIQAKKRIGRLKDFAQLRNIASSIITDKEILDSISLKS